MKNIKSLLTAIILCLGVYASAQEPDEIISYKQIGDTDLKLHIFHPDEIAPDGNPAILLFFGGGFRGGSVNQFYPFCERFKKIGVTGIAVEYRIKSKHNSTRDQSVMDGFSAMRYVRKNAEKFNIDPDRIAAGGGSAGGFIAASLATVTALNESTDDTSVSAVPDALVLFNPAVKLRPGNSNDVITDNNWNELSPYHNISEIHPPTLIMHGTEDETIPVQQVEDYCQKLQSLGIKCILKQYKGQGHGFFNKNRSEKYFELTCGEGLLFLWEIL